MKHILQITTVILAIIITQATLAQEKIQPGSNGVTAVQTDSIAPDHTGMRNLSSYDLSKAMVPGWNLGNALEAIDKTNNPGDETAWGNPKVTQMLIDSVKAAGIKSVRIPVAWSKFTDQNAFTIDTNWLARVEQVVNYILKDSMYAMINEHWDNGWIEPRYSKQAYVNNRLAVLWKQIAIRFRNYGDHLIFAGTNEILAHDTTYPYNGIYSSPTTEFYTVQNGYNQVFVNSVRSTGGRNAYRYLAVQGFNTNIDNTNNFFVMPADAEQSRLLVEVHYYDPYDFTINTGNTNIIQWGQYATDPGKVEPWANEAYADGQFQKMKSKFIDKGFGVLLGEYSAMARLHLGSDALNATHAWYRRYWTQYITLSLERHGLVPMYWDNGYLTDNASGIFNRSTGAKGYPDIIKALVDTTSIAISSEVEPKSINELPTHGALQQNYPNPFNPSTNITFEVPSRSYVTLKIVDVWGRDVATIVSEQLAAGSYSRLWNAANISSGVYFCELQEGPFRETKKLILLR